MKVELTSTPGTYAIEITGGAWAQMYAVWTYNAVYNPDNGTLNCSTGSRMNCSRFGETYSYQGTGSAVFTVQNNGQLKWSTSAAPDAEDLIATTVNFRKS